MAALIRSVAYGLGTRCVFLSESVKWVSEAVPEIQPNGSRLSPMAKLGAWPEQSETGKIGFVVSHVGAFRDDSDAPGLSREAKAHDVLIQPSTALLCRNLARSW